MNLIRVYEASYQLDNESVILSGLISEPIRALVRMPLVGLAREKGYYYIRESSVKNTEFTVNSNFEPPRTVDVITDEENYASDIEIVKEAPPCNS